MHERSDERGAVRLSLSGELDLAVADRLRSRLQQLARAHATVILDLSDLQFIDSTGLHVLITNFNQASRNGWQLRIDPNLTSPVRRVVEIIGIAHILWPMIRPPGTAHPASDKPPGAGISATRAILPGVGTSRDCPVCGATELEVAAIGCPCTDLDLEEEDECLAPVVWSGLELQETESVRTNGQRTG